MYGPDCWGHTCGVPSSSVAESYGLGEPIIRLGPNLQAFERRQRSSRHILPSRHKRWNMVGPSITQGSNSGSTGFAQQGTVDWAQRSKLSGLKGKPLKLAVLSGS